MGEKKGEELKVCSGEIPGADVFRLVAWGYQCTDSQKGAGQEASQPGLRREVDQVDAVVQGVYRCESWWCRRSFLRQASSGGLCQLCWQQDGWWQDKVPRVATETFISVRHG